MASYINGLKNKQEKLIPSRSEFDQITSLFSVYFEDILGLGGGGSTGQNEEILDDVMSVLLDIRTNAKANKDYATADAIRDQLKEIGIVIMDGKDGADWQIDA
jgi:cysteinyl-tRNA synthetase